MTARYPTLAAAVRESADRLEAQGAYAFDEYPGCQNRVVVDDREYRCAVALLWEDDIDGFLEIDSLLCRHRFTGLLAPGDVNEALDDIRYFHADGARSGAPLAETVVEIRAYADELDEVAS